MDKGTEAADILELLAQGPQSEVDIRYSLGMSRYRVSELLSGLVAAGKVKYTGMRERSSRVFALTSTVTAHRG